MAELAPIARPYAQAVFELARDGKQLPAWSSVLELAAAAAATSEFRALLQSPTADLKALAGLLAGICREQLPDCAPLSAGPQSGSDAAPAENLFRLLAENRRLAALPAIAEAYEALRARAENVVDVQVASATTLDESQQQRLTAALQKRLGKQVRLHLKLDPALLGGARLQVGDQVIDGSVRTRLEKLANAMTAA